MSDSQQQGKKKRGRKSNNKKVEQVPVKEEVNLNEIFQEKEPEPEEVKRPVSLPKTAEKKATPKIPVVEVDPDKVLRWLARIKVSGNFGQWFSGANFANHCVKDCFTVDGKELTIEEASQLISPHMYVKAG